MSYATVDDLISLFSESEMLELSDRERTGNVNVQVVNVAIDDSVSLINSFLAARYDLPLSSPPTVLKRICADIARHFLYDNQVPEAVEKKKDDAMMFLKAVAKGDVSLGLNIENEVALGDQQIEVVSDERVFTRDASKGFI